MSVICNQPARLKSKDRITASTDDVTSMKSSKTWPLSERNKDDDNNAVDNERKPLSCKTKTVSSSHIPIPSSFINIQIQTKCRFYLRQTHDVWVRQDASQTTAGNISEKNNKKKKNLSWQNSIPSKAPTNVNQYLNLKSNNLKSLSSWKLFYMTTIHLFDQ